MAYKHIIFDIDGTLLDTEFAVLHSLQDTIYSFLNKHIPTNELGFALGIPGEVALTDLGVKDIEAANEFWNNKMMMYQQHIRLFDGISDLLRELHQHQYKLGIVTSKTKKEYETDFVPHNISQFFESVICVEDSSMPKPSAEPLLTYLERNSILAKDAIYIGDTVYDYKCACSAGVDFGLALWGCNKPHQIESNYKFETPSHILEEFEK